MNLSNVADVEEKSKANNAASSTSEDFPVFSSVSVLIVIGLLLFLNPSTLEHYSSSALNVMYLQYVSLHFH